MNGPDRDKTRNQGKAAQAPGQEKLHTITNAMTGETREVTQRTWREEGDSLRAQGFTRPEDEEAPEAEDETPDDEGSV